VLPFEVVAGRPTEFSISSDRGIRVTPVEKFSIAFCMGIYV